MQTKHDSETFTDCCIESEYSGRTFRKCVFNACYLEVGGAKFINCTFKDCHIFVGEDAFVDCDFLNSTTPLFANR